MNFLLSGYYGFANAGDEAVLAAMLEHLSASLGERAPESTFESTFTVTSGDAAHTTKLHHAPRHAVTAIGRGDFKALRAAIGACDVFLSGGGSLLQDVTSVRNAIYYSGLIRLAQLARKPTMIYAQGVGPLRRAISQKLARIAVQGARAVTVRDDDSKALLQRIGVRREIEVTADPVWALSPDQVERPTDKIWCASLRDWPGRDAAIDKSTFERLSAAAREANAQLRFLPMQAGRDRALLDEIGVDATSIVDVTAQHPRAVMAAAGACSLMLAMRLHALIFAAAQGVPCVAINYDPKVEALAKLLGTPLLNDASEAEMSRLPQLAREARSPQPEWLAELKQKARRNAQIAVALRSL